MAFARAWFALLVSLALIGSLGCARLTPAHDYSGWRSDGKASGRRLPERVKVLALTEAERNILKTDISKAQEGVPPQAVLGSIGGMAADFLLKKLAGAIEKNVKSAAALHVSVYKASDWGRFYSESDKIDDDGVVIGKRKIVDLGGVAVVREMQFPAAEACPGGLDPTQTLPRNAGKWCSVLFVAFELELGSAESDGIVQLRPIQNSLALFRSRAKVVDPTWYAPWTWWTDDANSKWWAPTRGEKNYLDELQVTLSIEPAYADTALQVSSPDQAKPLFEETWKFKQVAIDERLQPVAKTNEAAWSRPFPVVPVGTLVSHVDPAGRPILRAGDGPYVLRAKVEEKDSMAERLGDLAKIIKDKSKDAIDYVKGTAGL